MNKEKQYTRQNEFNREKYDRYSLMLPKGTKEQYQEYAKANNVSLNELIKKAIDEYIQNHPLNHENTQNEQ